MITLLKDDLHGIAITLAVIILGTVVLTSALTYLLLARTSLRRAWASEAHARGETARAKKQLAELRYAVRDVIARLNSLGTSGSNQYAARVLEDTVGPLLGDPEQRLLDDARQA